MNWPFIMNRLSSLSITTKLIALVLCLQFVTISTLAYFNELSQEKEEYAKADEKLRLVAFAVNDFVLQDYHDEILDKNSISADAYLELMLKLSSYVDKAEVQYVYSFVRRNKEVLVTSTSVTQEDFKDEKYELFFEQYNSVSQALVDSFENKESFYEQTSDKYGHVRTIIIPFSNKYGETYIVGVDIEMKTLQELILETRKEVLMISLIIFLVSSILSGLLVHGLMKRLPFIQEGLLEFFDYLNSKRRDVNPIEVSGGDELSKMAALINDNVKLIAININKDNELIDEIASISNEVKKGSFSSRIEGEGNNPALNEVKEIMNDVLVDMQFVIMDILSVLKEFSKQNYKCKLDEYTLDGEMAKLVEQMNIFGKNISDYMLNTAYDALNLEKDSKFLNDYMQGLIQRVNVYLKEVNAMKQTLGDLRKNESLMQEASSKIKEERVYAFDALSKLSVSVKEGSELKDRALLENQLKVTELIGDCEQSLSLICKSNEQLHAVMQNAQNSISSLSDDFNLFETRVKEGSSSVDQTQKVSHNLNELSKRMREYIEKSEFSGKENITNLMNFTER